MQALNTPMMRQYLEIKEQHKDSILFFRLGDFYEMFFEDAKIASKILNIALTSRNKGKEDSVPLCGIPHHAAQSYIDELISKGLKVAICEQVEDPKLAKSVVKREVVQVVTPGLLTEGDNLSAKDNNFLASVYRGPDVWGIAYLDISTGDFHVTQVEIFRELFDEITRIKPKEILIPENLDDSHRLRLSAILKDLGCNCENKIDDWVYNDSIENFKRHYSIPSLESLGLSGQEAATRAAAAIIHYAKLTQKASLSHLRRPSYYNIHDYMVLDSATIRNLEIVAGASDGEKDASLLSVIDKTMTPMGGRKIKEWLLFPLLSVSKIVERQDVVGELIAHEDELERIGSLFKQVRDLERLSSKVSMMKANARDLRALAATIEIIPQLKRILAGFRASLVKNISNDLDELSEIKGIIERAIVAEPSLSLKEGGIIKDGFNAELDGYRRVKREGKTFIASLEKTEKEKTGISSLKVGYNKVFGYYIEVTKSNLKFVPSSYIRKQTLANAERYITPELKEYEEKVLTAEEKIGLLEYDIFSRVRDEISKAAPQLLQNSKRLAELDTLCAFANLALQCNYTRPQVIDSDSIVLEEGRHPVLEKIKGAPFIPNDVSLNTQKDQLLIITGPNMAGKSTILKQTALITVLAQIGSFVPAKGAQIGIVDKIFTRVGARDRLTSGYSTFMVEMMETSNILHNATKKSLIVLDEIGRGTSTFDGVSIAWAVAEYIHDKIGAKTLFATHYHELCDLVKVKDRVKNLHVTAKEWEGRLIFLRKLVPGPVNRSYGIQVAKLAGLPEGVVERAREILANLETGEYDCVDMPKIAYSKKNQDKPAAQLTLFKEFDGFMSKELSSLDLNSMTPMDALRLLSEWKNRLKT